MESASNTERKTESTPESICNEKKLKEMSGKHMAGSNEKEYDFDEAHAPLALLGMNFSIIS